MKTSENQKQLTGKELLDKVKTLGNISKEKKALACGYYTVNEDGQKRVNKIQFLNALMKARGIVLDTTSDEKAKAGRIANYIISVQSNGNLLIGSAYTKQMGLNPGDEFEIKLGRKNIRLTRLDFEE